jgi:hypothetical protein
VPPCCPFTRDPPDAGGGVRFTQSNAAGVKATCDQGPGCLPPGASCSVPGTGCCAIGGKHDCVSGVCVAHIPPPTCQGKPKPTQSCSSQWDCCDPDGWVCGNCR